MSKKINKEIYYLLKDIEGNFTQYDKEEAIEVMGQNDTLLEVKVVKKHKKGGLIEIK